MLKKVKEKRIEVFKKSFPDYKISDKGNYYVRLGVSKQKKVILKTGRSVTKNTLDSLGTTLEFEKSDASVVLLLKPTGALKVKFHRTAWSNLTLKLLDNHLYGETYKGIIEVFFIGRKYEWMKNYKNLWKYKYFQSFNSLKEAKNYIGFDFISNKDFYKIFKDDWYSHEFDSIILADKKKNVFNLLKNADQKVMHTLDDYIKLAYEHNIKPIIPKGKNRLTQLHDDLVWEVSKKTAQDYSKEQKFYPIDNEKFESCWREKGLVFKRLNTPYEMYVEGCKQRHCLGTNYYNSLGNQSFYVFEWEGERYDLQLHQNGAFGQFYGYKNLKTAPQELRNIIREGCDLMHSIEDRKPKLKNYPKKGMSIYNTSIDFDLAF